MDFTSYQLISHSTSSLNTASYLNSTEYTMFVNGYATDLWYGFSPNDVIELGVWDRNETLIGWDVLNQSKSFTSVTSSYINALDFPVTYSYFELNPDFTLYNNQKILVNPTEQLSSSFGILSGSYLLTYNFVRNMAGDSNSPLIIKDISPSRKEIKLIPVTASNASYNAFLRKKVILRDVSPLYLTAVKTCVYGQIYNTVLPYYQNEINTIKSLFFLNTDGEMLTFFKRLYEDFVVFTTTPSITPSGISSTNDRIIRIQGIQTYFTNYLLSNSDKILSFSEIDNSFGVFVSASIEQKFSPIGIHPSSKYVSAKAFVYDFFTKYYYQTISDTLSSAYNDKYFGILKNALNFGNNSLLLIVDSDYMDEREAPDDPFTLLLKLKNEIPYDVSLQTKCWVSNVSLVPTIVNAIVKSPTETIVHTIGAPNFSTQLPNVSLANNNRTYTATDLKVSDNEERQLTISRNITELSVDYSDFTNFIIFSSAEMRLKIFKNKVISIANLNSEINVLNGKNTTFLVASGSIYPFYSTELESLQSQSNDIVNSFDGYESYLYRSGNYAYASGSFAIPYFVTENDLSASLYDKENKDSLINNCPSYILSNEDYDDYIVFLSMVGHFFDNIYIYIAQLPTERRLGYTATEEFTRRIVDYMLQTFGWDLSDSLEQATLINNYLNSEQIDGLNQLSAEERLKAIRNRLLINLPQIYKTKGTEESIRLLLSCYGIPTSLLSIREFGGVNYNTNDAAYTIYERSFMYQWNSSSKYDQFSIDLPDGPYTYLFKLVIDDATLYSYNREQILFGSVISQSISTDISSSGQWAVGFERTRNQNSGKIFFRIGYAGAETFKLVSPEFPLFDSNIYSIMIRRNSPSDFFQFSPSTYAIPSKYDLVIQRNEFGREIIKISTSSVCYNTASNFTFNGSASLLKIGGWFTDINGQAFVGAFDKLQVWKDTVQDISFEDYVNSINSYNFTGSRIPHQSLMFRMHVDYPFNVSQSGRWVNGNPFYAISSSAKFSKYLGTLDTNGGMDAFTATSTWFGAYKDEYNSINSCSLVPTPVYPWQFRIVEYPSTWGISKYGPNKFRNEKVREISQSIATRFDDKERSTFVIKNNISPDSNQLGLFADPQDFKNKDIVRYFGNYDIMDAIGDPSNQFSSSYNALKTFRNIYAESKNEYSGSKTLFNELGILYRLYFNKTIFDSIKNLVPARANILTGIVVEPTILERPKYSAKQISSSMNAGASAVINRIMRMTQSLNFSTDVNVDMTSISFPSIVYPQNYAYRGTYIRDIQGKYELGHFSGPIRSPEPIINIVSTPMAPLYIECAQSTGQVGLDYNSGFYVTGGLPPYTYFFNGNLPPGLTFNSSTGNITGNPTVDGIFGYSASVIDTSPIPLTVTASCGFTILPASLPPGQPCGGSISYTGGQTFPSEFTMSLGTNTGRVSLTYDTRVVPDKFVVIIGGVEVINTGYRGLSRYQAQLNHTLGLRGQLPETIKGIGQGVEVFNKTTSDSQAIVRVYGPIPGTVWTFTLSCPY